MLDRNLPPFDLADATDRFFGERFAPALLARSRFSFFDLMLR